MKTLIQATYNDVISENRNKAFGQYELRTHYSERLFKAQTGVISGLTLVGFFLLLNQPKTQAENPIEMHELTVLKKIEIELDAPKKPEPQPESKSRPASSKTSASKATSASSKSPLLPMEVAKEAGDAKIDSLTTEPDPVLSRFEEGKAPSGEAGNTQGTLGAPGGQPTGTGQNETGGSNGSGMDDAKDFVEIEPEFQGDLEQFIARNTRYPGKALQSGIEGQVFVAFVVDEKGKVTRPVVLKGIGYGCDEEALRVIQSLPDWKPGKNNGNPVKVRLRIPLRFRLGN